MAHEAGVEAGLAQRPTLAISRIFDAPRSLIWSAWTKPEMLVGWLGPTHCPSISARSELKVGGGWSAILRPAEGGQALEMSGTYVEVVPQERLVFTFTWGEGHEDGAAVETIVSVALSDGPGGSTRVDLYHRALKSAESLEGHRHGWMSSFDRLDDWITHHAMRRVRQIHRPPDRP